VVYGNDGTTPALTRMWFSAQLTTSHLTGLTNTNVDFLPTSLDTIRCQRNNPSDNTCNGDTIAAIKKSNTGTHSTEVHVMDIDLPPYRP
jgi:hypothetical protein